MSAADQERIRELQRSNKIARDALERIKTGHWNGSPESVAEAALDAMFPLEKKQPLQGLVGHARRPNR